MENAAPEGAPLPQVAAFDESVYHYWRKAVESAHSTWGGIQWHQEKLYDIYERVGEVLLEYVGYEEPSPFKRASAFVVAFIAHCPIVGQFERHSLGGHFEQTPRWSGAIIAFEYARYMLAGAELRRDDGTTVTLDKPIKVSEHTYIDIIQAIARMGADSEMASEFHLTALLLEQLAYMENGQACYPRCV